MMKSMKVMHDSMHQSYYQGRGRGHAQGRGRVRYGGRGCGRGRGRGEQNMGGGIIATRMATACIWEASAELQDRPIKTKQLLRT